VISVGSIESDIDDSLLRIRVMESLMLKASTVMERSCFL
jgi:hypothetical protein